MKLEKIKLMKDQLQYGMLHATKAVFSYIGRELNIEKNECGVIFKNNKW